MTRLVGFVNAGKWKSLKEQNQQSLVQRSGIAFLQGYVSVTPTPLPRVSLRAWQWSEGLSACYSDPVESKNQNPASKQAENTIFPLNLSWSFLSRAWDKEEQQHQQQLRHVGTPGNSQISGRFWWSWFIDFDLIFCSWDLFFGWIL